MVRYKISQPDLLVAEFHEFLLGPRLFGRRTDWKAVMVIRNAVANTISELSEHGKISIF